MRSRVAMVLLAALATPLTAQQHYQRQPGVDVQHYRWSVTLSDSTDEIAGDALITVTFTQPELRSIFFDLSNKAATGRRGMVVTAVSVDSAATTYTHVNDRVTV